MSSTAEELSTPAVATPWLSDLQNRSKDWDERRAAAVLTRLGDERERLCRERALQERELANLEQQISLLQKSRGGVGGGGGGGGVVDATAATADGAAASLAAEARAASPCALCSYVSRTHFLWVFSGSINGILKLIFCLVYGALIVDAAPHLLKDKLPILVGTQLAASFVTNLFTARYSSVGASISGPDIVHALVMKTMTTTVAQITDDPEVALSTVLFLLCFTSFVISATWLLVARFRLSVFIDFFPVSVVTGFLGCIGYKVLKEAIHIAVGEYWYDPSSPGFWRLLVPALPVGVPLYILKRFHVGDSKISMLFYLLAPPVIFFIAQAGSGKSLAQTRSDGWLPEESAQGVFYAQWTHLQWSKISGEAVLATLPETVVLAVMVTLDAFLYLKMTKRELQTKMDMENELYVIGFQNMLSTLFVGSVGYSQVKFNKINYAITKDAQVGDVVAVSSLLLSLLFPTRFNPRSFLLTSPTPIHNSQRTAGPPTDRPRCSYLRLFLVFGHSLHQRPAPLLSRGSPNLRRHVLPRTCHCLVPASDQERILHRVAHHPHQCVHRPTASDRVAHRAPFAPHCCHLRASTRSGGIYLPVRPRVCDSRRALWARLSVRCGALVLRAVPRGKIGHPVHDH